MLSGCIGVGCADRRCRRRTRPPAVENQASRSPRWSGRNGAGHTNASGHDVTADEAGRDGKPAKTLGGIPSAGQRSSHHTTRESHGTTTELLAEIDRLRTEVLAHSAAEADRTSKPADPRSTRRQAIRMGGVSAAVAVAGTVLGARPAAAADPNDVVKCTGNATTATTGRRAHSAVRCCGWRTRVRPRRRGRSTPAPVRSTSVRSAVTTPTTTGSGASESADSHLVAETSSPSARQDRLELALVRHRWARLHHRGAASDRGHAVRHGLDHSPPITRWAELRRRDLSDPIRVYDSRRRSRTREPLPPAAPESCRWPTLVTSPAAR